MKFMKYLTHIQAVDTTGRVSSRGGAWGKLPPSLPKEKEKEERKKEREERDGRMYTIRVF